MPLLFRPIHFLTLITLSFFSTSSTSHHLFSLCSLSFNYKMVKTCGGRQPPPNVRNTPLTKRQSYPHLLCHLPWPPQFKQRPRRLHLQLSPKECSKRLAPWNLLSTYLKQHCLRHHWVSPTLLSPSLPCQTTSPAFLTCATASPPQQSKPSPSRSKKKAKPMVSPPSTHLNQLIPIGSLNLRKRNCLNSI